MAAFDRIKSGIPEMDDALDNIRLGDNVVWRVSSLSEFRLFMEPYLEQAIRDGRNIIYFRFASHEPLVEDRPEVKTIEVPLSHRFETFTVDIHNEIEKAGRDAFYIFDCLSELQAMWATDLMMGNFFRVTCPFLFILDTVAFFPIIRGKALGPCDQKDPRYHAAVHRRLFGQKERIRAARKGLEQKLRYHVPAAHL